MAQKRMLDKKISISEQVANLPTEAALIFTWSIPHADDLGLLPKSLRTLKAMIVPMLDMTLETFGNHMESIVSQGLYETWKHEGEEFYRIAKFSQNQTLKKDRKPYTLAKNINSWEEVEALGFHLETIGNPSKEKIREDKLSKDKKSIVSYEPIDRELAEFLLDQIKANNSNFKQPNLYQWADHIRKMREIDKRPVEYIRAVIAWCQHDSFWKANILSAAKLREKYDQLYAKAKGQFEKQLTQGKDYDNPNS